MDTLKVRNFGPIQEANVAFGDLTLLVGPQASGKSIFLQLLKLIEDKMFIKIALEQKNYVWNSNTDNILNLYFGDGIGNIWTDKSQVIFDNRKVGKSYLQQKTNVPLTVKYGNRVGKILYIPAQRVLCVPNGSPKEFMGFDDTTPFVFRQFSDLIQGMMTHQNWNQEIQFPRIGKPNDLFVQLFKDSIFQNGKILFDARRGQRKFSMQLGDMNLPFMTWSSGQKEFLPMLMAFYWLLDASKLRDDVKQVIIEEPEMGLHPQAIRSVILEVINLIKRGYKVIISTHSPVFLEFAWAFQFLKQSNAKEDAFRELFDLPKSAGTKKLFTNILSKTIKTYYFDRKNNKVNVLDISSLDAGNENPAIAEWGGFLRSQEERVK